MQGYDAAALLAIGMDAVKGDIKATDTMLYKAMRAAKIDSPRGPMTFSASQNPVQNIYLREVKNGKNAYVKIAARRAGRSGHRLQAGVVHWWGAPRSAGTRIKQISSWPGSSRPSRLGTYFL